MTKVLVIGATGFIGRACLKVLEETDLDIHAVYRNKTLIPLKKVYWHQCDILNHDQISALISKLRPDYLIDLAWIVDHKICMTSELNINYIFATVHLYKEFSRNGGKKAIFLGTCAEYEAKDLPCDEIETPLQPTSLYGLCKEQTLCILNQLKMQQSWYAAFTWVRIFHIYGPHESKNRLIPYVINSYLKGKIPVLDNPHSIRDYIYVENLAEIIIHLLQKKSDNIINAGSGNPMTIGELVNKIHLRFFSEQTPPLHGPNALEKYDCLIPDLSRLAQLKIQPSISFELGLDRTFEWFKLQLEQVCL